jgi:undecaprenyl diphosphate synthase
MVPYRSVSERLAERRLKKGASPGHVAVVFEKDIEPSKLRDFYVWCEELGVEKATACVPDADENHRERLEDALGDLDPPVETTEGDERAGGSRVLSYATGTGELVGVFRRLTEDIEEGEVEPDEIDFSEIEKRLAVPGEPDLVIDTTGKSLSDVLVWQTVYSELCQIDDFNRSVFVGCLDDYRERERRFGR